MRDLTSWIQTWTCRVLPLSLLSLCVLADLVFRDDQLWENSECKLENSETGECVKAVNCPKKILAIQQGNHTNETRCGFSGSDEIVCCEKKVSARIEAARIRPAVAACNTYTEWLKNSRNLSSGVFVFQGVFTKPIEFPQMVALGYIAGPGDERVVDGMKYECGGTLISKDRVLTAAHCVSNVDDLVPVEVMLGTTELNSTKAKRRLRVPISKIIKHPAYRRSFNYHDIAVIQLEKPVLFTEYVRPACLMTEPLGTLTEGLKKPLTVVGWGATDIDGSRSTKLFKAPFLEIVDMTTCSASYKQPIAQLPSGLDEGMICAADLNTGRKSDTCRGDSGGPLLIDEDQFQRIIAVLVGVTSFGLGCGTSAPGIYTSVYKYLDWIEAQVWPGGAPRFVD